MASRPADPDVAEFAGQLFFRLWRASHTRVAEALATLDLTPASFALLNVLGSRTGANQQETGTLMGIDPSTMVSLIDGLEDAGLAERRPHPKDRRAREVTLTPKGRRVAKRARDLAFDVEDEVLRGLTAPQRREMINLMRRALEGAPPQSPWSETEGD
ncbi:MAG: MarR family transcriptional regulator [Solirubrobacterales bacterium]